MGDLVNGQVLADRICEEIRPRIEKCRVRGIAPLLAVLSVGATPASRLYLRRQHELSGTLGIGHRELDLPADSTLEAILTAVHGLNADSAVTGIMVQVPLPDGISTAAVRAALDPAKDVEGVHPANLGMVLQGTASIAPCTAMAAVEVLRSRAPDLRGAEVVIVGRSEVVGKPAALLLLALGKAAPTVTVCHTGTRDLATHTRAADHLIVAAGKVGLIRGDMVQPGAGVVDVGIHRCPELDSTGNPRTDARGKAVLRTVGDVDLDSVLPVCGWITPVPGGVGPVTVALLMRNAVACLEARADHIG